MAFLNTDSDNIALYDSVTGIAFGPTFVTEDHLRDYRRWLMKNYPHFDQRAATINDHRRRYDEWFDQRVDPVTGDLKEAS